MARGARTQENRYKMFVAGEMCHDDIVDWPILNVAMKQTPKTVNIYTNDRRSLGHLDMVDSKWL